MLTNSSPRSRVVWFLLSLSFATLYGFWAMQQAFTGDYVVQDDARQHIFWMQRLVDPDLFPHDLIADYFQGVAPLGYTALYQGAAQLGLEPAIFSKILPFFLGIVTAAYSYWVTFALLPIPLAGFISSVGLSQSLWYSSELASATPRGFLYPLLLAFLYYIVRNRKLLSLLALILQALFYPQISLICLGILTLRLIHWHSNKPSLSSQKLDYWLFIIGFCLVAGIILYAQGNADFGAVFTRHEALAMPEFQKDGRNAFFSEGLDYWVNGRSGILHERGFIPATLAAGVLLPFLLVYPNKSRLRSLISPQIYVLLQLLIVSFGLYFLAHVFLFQLHLPSRYTNHTLRTAIALASGISWVILLDDILKGLSTLRLAKNQSLKQKSRYWITRLIIRVVPTILVLIFLGIIVGYPLLFFDEFPKVGYYNFASGKAVYDYLAAQPKDTVVASLSVEAGNIPTFSRRSVLISPEHAIAYHKGYYHPFRQRAQDLLEAQYTAEPDHFLTLIQNYKIDFWLLDQNAFQPAYVGDNKWLLQYQPMANNAVQKLTEGQQPILQRAIPSCTVLNADSWMILEADCVQDFAENLQ